MNPDPHHFYLFAAYFVTWAIHGTYLFILSRKAACALTRRRMPICRGNRV